MKYFLLYHTPSMRKVACFDSNNVLIQKVTMANVSKIGFPQNKDKVVYYDTAPNHCPYIWSTNFFATTCKVNNSKFNLSIQTKDIIFYCTEYKSKNPFKELLCDLVFEVHDINDWPDSNLWNYENHKLGQLQAASAFITPNNSQALIEHFYPSAPTHPWPASVTSQRKTYISDSAKSYQAQDTNFRLVDILPTIKEHLTNSSNYLMDLTFLQANKSKRTYYKSNNTKSFGTHGEDGLKNRLKYGQREIPIFQLDDALGQEISNYLSKQPIRHQGNILEQLKNSNSNQSLI